MGQWADAAADLTVGKYYRPSGKVNLAPAQPESFARSPPGQRKETRGRHRRGPDTLDLSHAESLADCPIFIVHQSPLATAVGKSDYAARWVVRAHAMVHCVGEDRPDEPDCPARGTPATFHSGEPARLRLHFGGGLAFSKPGQIFEQSSRAVPAMALRLFPLGTRRNNAFWLSLSRSGSPRFERTRGRGMAILGWLPNCALMLLSSCAHN